MLSFDKNLRKFFLYFFTQKKNKKKSKKNFLIFFGGVDLNQEIFENKKLRPKPFLDHYLIENMNNQITYFSFCVVEIAYITF